MIQIERNWIYFVIGLYISSLCQTVLWGISILLTKNRIMNFTTCINHWTNKNQQIPKSIRICGPNVFYLFNRKSMVLIMYRIYSNYPTLCTNINKSFPKLDFDLGSNINNHVYSPWSWALLKVHVIKFFLKSWYESFSNISIFFKFNFMTTNS